MEKGNKSKTHSSSEYSIRINDREISLFQEEKKQGGLNNTKAPKKLLTIIEIKTSV